MARYRILLADALVGMGLQWPEGVSLAGQLEAGTTGTHWHLLDDPGAPAELEGREVGIRLARGDDGEPVIRERRAVLVHLCPPDGSGLTPCCGAAPFEIPRGDRLTAVDDAVTCEGDPVPAEAAA
jgi:hypothetical protein